MFWLSRPRWQRIVKVYALVFRPAGVSEQHIPKSLLLILLVGTTSRAFYWGFRGRARCVSSRVLECLRGANDRQWVKWSKRYWYRWVSPFCDQVCRKENNHLVENLRCFCLSLFFFVTTFVIVFHMLVHSLISSVLVSLFLDSIYIYLLRICFSRFLEWLFSCIFVCFQRFLAFVCVCLYVCGALLFVRSFFCRTDRITSRESWVIRSRG